MLCSINITFGGYLMSVIKDGSGTGVTLKVNAENRADVSSVSRSITQHINERYEKHLSVTFEAIDPTGADDYFFYTKNTGTKNIHLTKFRFKSSVIGTIEVHSVTGTSSAVTPVVPVNRTVGSSESLIATIGTGVNLTGLSNAGVMIRLTLSIADTDFIDDAPSHIIIPPGQAIALLWDTSTGILAGTVDMYEDQGID